MYDKRDQVHQSLCHNEHKHRLRGGIVGERTVQCNFDDRNLDYCTACQLSLLDVLALCSPFAVVACFGHAVLNRWIIFIDTVGNSHFSIRLVQLVQIAVHV